MHKRGNISILVIFILLASSLLGVLSLNYVQQMIKQTATVQAYYKSYYLAKAGVELSLTEIKHRGIGFNQTLQTGNALMTQNFACSPQCTLSSSISGTASLLSQNFWQETSGCVAPFVLAKRDSLLIPLFKDAISSSYVADVFSTGISYTNLAQILQSDKLTVISPSNGSPGNVTLGIIILSGEDLYENGIFFKSGMALSTNGIKTFKTMFETYFSSVDPALITYGNESFLDKGYRMYLLISNPSDATQSFCLASDNANAAVNALSLPTASYYIQSQASYLGSKVGLDATYAQPVPNFLFDTYINN